MVPSDLDNADNVTRASLFLALRYVPKGRLGVTDWLAKQEGIVTDLNDVDNPHVSDVGVEYRNRLYSSFFEAVPREWVVWRLCSTDASWS
jgi:hypothetical protein